MFDDLMNQQAVIDFRKSREMENPLYRAIQDISVGKSFENYTIDKKRYNNSSIWNKPNKVARILRSRKGSMVESNSIIDVHSLDSESNESNDFKESIGIESEKSRSVSVKTNSARTGSIKLHPVESLGSARKSSQQPSLSVENIEDKNKN